MEYHPFCCYSILNRISKDGLNYICEQHNLRWRRCKREVLEIKILSLYTKFHNSSDFERIKFDDIINKKMIKKKTKLEYQEKCISLNIPFSKKDSILDLETSLLDYYELDEYFDHYGFNKDDIISIYNLLQSRKKNFINRLHNCHIVLSHAKTSLLERLPEDIYNNIWKIVIEMLIINIKKGSILIFMNEKK